MILQKNNLKYYYDKIYDTLNLYISKANSFYSEEEFSGVFFIKDEENQNEILKKFSSDVSKSLNLKLIFESTVKAIVDSIGTKKIYIATLENTSNDYILTYSDQSLADLVFALSKDSAIVKWIQKNENYLSMEDFVNSVEYKTMLKSEKLQIAKLGIAYCIGMKENGKLIGIILFSNYGRKKKLRRQDISIIASIGSIASIAIKNAHMYEKAYLESRTDELTGVLNRRRFYELIQEQFEMNKEESIALIIINVDDFKLFNQLYGTKQGDYALKTIADIIKSSIGKKGKVARYSCKEFAIILPGYDVFSAKKLTESIRNQILNIKKDAQNYRKKIITISAGISIATYGERTVKELIDNAEHAVYHVKRRGKNAIKVFDTFVFNSEDTIEEDYANIYDEYKTTIYALTAAIDAKDHYTFSHSDNVASYAVSLAVELSLNKDIIENIRQAALLHDIGKISIPESILNKPGKLTDDEYLIMQGHVEAAIDIIRHLPSLDYVIPAVLSHHERYDGFGYPRRIFGEDIPLTGRILCIADSFDSMISKRCYKNEMSVDCALNILLEEAGKQFDPNLVKVFIALVKSGKIITPSLESVEIQPSYKSITNSD
jgi:diguanylate cyclase (GGDEF)-like protein/putative nucleotidyltransferase with HDIG domain